jgi:hypothetical protein
MHTVSLHMTRLQVSRSFECNFLPRVMFKTIEFTNVFDTIPVQNSGDTGYNFSSKNGYHDVFVVLLSPSKILTLQLSFVFHYHPTFSVNTK